MKICEESFSFFSYDDLYKRLKILRDKGKILKFFGMKFKNQVVCI